MIAYSWTHVACIRHVHGMCGGWKDGQKVYITHKCSYNIYNVHCIHVVVGSEAVCNNNELALEIPIYKLQCLWDNNC